jgi:hypothetical protein
MFGNNKIVFRYDFMQSSSLFKKIGKEIKFKSEKELEDFVIINLEPLFGMKFIAKQYRVNGEICDILAVDSEDKLNILELKNTEDRYVVQQLTRYYHNLFTTKPKLDGIKYDNEIKLIAIAPSFHYHNLTDRQYSKLEVEFWSFNVFQENKNKKTCFEIRNIESGQQKKIEITETSHVESDLHPKAEIDKKEDWNEDIIDYYMRLNYAGKLGITSLTSEECIAYSKRFRSQCKREFIVKFYDDSKETTRLTTLKFKLPSKVLPWQFSMWAWSNMKNIDSAGDSGKLYEQYLGEDNYIIRRVYYK